MWNDEELRKDYKEQPQRGDVMYLILSTCLTLILRKQMLTKVLHMHVMYVDRYVPKWRERKWSVPVSEVKYFEPVGEFLADLYILVENIMGLTVTAFHHA